MKPDYTDITVVLDRSGSMFAIKEDTEGGFAHFVEEQRKVPGECRLTLVQFDTEYEVVHSGVPVAEVPRFVLLPRGGTALLDAIGRAINETGARLAAMPEDQRPGQVIFVILTDGEENSSTEFDLRQVRKMIEHQSAAYNWKFVYLGANQDAIEEAGKMGIKSQHAMNYSHTPQGAAQAFVGTARAVARSRTSQSLDFTDEERKKSLES